MYVSTYLSDLNPRSYCGKRARPQAGLGVSGYNKMDTLTKIFVMDSLICGLISLKVITYYVVTTIG